MTLAIIIVQAEEKKKSVTLAIVIVQAEEKKKKKCDTSCHNCSG